MIDEAAQGRNYFIVTRMGHPRAVVLGIEQYRDLLEEIDIKAEQTDPDFQAALAEARQDIELGRTLTLEELDQELGFTADELNSTP